MIRVLIAAATTAAIAEKSSLNQYEWVGQLMPVLIAVIMVIIVRMIFDMNATKKRAWNYNLLVMSLCSIFAAVFTHEWSLSAGGACMLGMGAGSLGIGIISFGKTFLVGALDFYISKYKKGSATPPSD